MSLTPEQIAKIRQKEATTPDALKRNPLSNYRAGYFHVTLNTRGEAPVLSAVVGDIDGEGAFAPHCEYTELGLKVKEAIASISDFHKYASVLEAEVMPEHIHMLLYLQPGGKEHLGKVIGGFMGGCSHAYWDVLGIDWRKDHPTQGDKNCANIGRRASARRLPDRDRDHTHSFRGPALFVRGYNDVEAVTPEEIETKRQYIRDNPRKRLLQRAHHECFRKYRHQHSRNWTVARVMAAVVADRTFSYDATRREMAMLNILTRLNKDEIQTGPTVQAGDVSKDVCQVTTVTLPSGRQLEMLGIGMDYIGNKSLLYSDRKLPLVCHRADVGQFEQQKAAVLAAARQGWIIVSAFISPKERDIKEQLMVELLPFIEILDNGITDKYKGVGKAFYALAEDRLCQVTPWQYQYHRDEKVSREMCLVMNELARIISGKVDDWWKH